MTPYHKLLNLVAVLWREVTPERQAELRVEMIDMQWAFPSTGEILWKRGDWLTTQQVAEAFGVKPHAVQNWPRRYGIPRPVNGKWRWEDVDQVRLKRHIGKAA